MKFLASFLCIVVTMSLIGCGGGGSVTSNGGFDGLGTSLPPADPGTSIIIDHRQAFASATLIPDDKLAQGRALKTIFGHNSVGANILDGMTQLEGHNARYSATIVNFPASDAGGCVSQFAVGTNGNLQSKIDDFVAKIQANSMPTAQVATFKFCFVDFDSGTDATALFNAYTTAMSQLEVAHPGITFVYWTVPIQTTYLKSSDDYNKLVRNYCIANNKVLFDIASIESYSPFDTLTGGAQPVMYSGYTTDGGHLNSTGSIRVARAWWWLMARIAGWNGS